MNEKSIKIKNFQKIKTEEGELFTIFRDWDSFHDNYVPKMVYATTIKPGLSKGPILHKERKYFITAISGEVDVEIFSFETKELKKINLRKQGEDEYSILLIDPGVPIRIINSSNDETATVINCPSKSWSPENPDTWKWKSWEEFFKDEIK